jgi:Txe/YoeB family toxin of toxin-antitoxin system
MKKVIFLSNLIAASVVLGMQNNFTEKNHDPSKNFMRPVNAENSSASAEEKRALYKKWISKIVQMKISKADFNAPQNSDGQTILMCATREADSTIMQQILNAKNDFGYRQIDINAKDKNGDTALSIAMEMNDEEKIFLLLKNGANIADINTSDIQRILMSATEAANAGNNEKILLLLKNGADLKLIKEKISKNTYKKLKNIYEQIRSANDDFKRVISTKDIPLGEIELLLKDPLIDVNFQGKMGVTALMIAVDMEREDIVHLLLNQPNINVNIRDDEERTALGVAVRHRGVKIVRLLLNRKDVDVNIKNDKGDTALIIASATNNVEIVKMLLSYPGIDPNLQDHNGGTALIYSINNRNEEIAELLLQKWLRVDVNIQDGLGNTPLISAAANGCEKIVKILLDYSDVNPNLQDRNGGTALIYASRHGYKKVVETLLKHPEIDVNMRNDSGVNALLFAAGKGDEEIVKLLLNHSKIDLNIQDNEGFTALGYATSIGCEKIVELLLDCSKINFNVQDNNGFTVLDDAIINGHKGIVELLLDRLNIDINREDSNAALRAVVYGREEIIKLFLEKGLDVNKTYGSEKNTLLMIAAEAGNLPIVNLLLEQPNINVNAVNDKGETALDFAKRSKRKKIIRLIQSKMTPQDQEVQQSQQIQSSQKDQQSQEIQPLKKKPDQIGEIKKQLIQIVSRGEINEIDSLLDKISNVKDIVNMRNEKGDTFLIIASNNGNLQAVRALIEYGADLSLEDAKGNNALIIAAEKGHLDVVDELLFRKVNINSLGQYKRTALMAAAENGHIRVVKFLLKKGAKVSIKDGYGQTALDIINGKKPGKGNNNYVQIKTILESRSKQFDSLVDIEAETLSNKWEIVVDKNYKEGLEFWKKNSQAIYSKILSLVEDIEKNGPFRGLGKPEPLTGNLKGSYSRRITGKYRLIYETDGEKVILKSCDSNHYKK